MPKRASAGAAARKEPAAVCDQDPYTPLHYKPPCEQPRPVAACSGGFCAIEPGCFVMGSPFCEWGRAKHGNDPVQVTLTHAFRVQKHELTQREWKGLGLSNPSGTMPDGSGDCARNDCPVGNVTWFEALEFANRFSLRNGLPACYALSSCSGELAHGFSCEGAASVTPSIYDCRGYRLPTSAEWEYAARAGTRSTVHTGDIRGDVPLHTCYDETALSPIAWYCANAGPRTHAVGRKAPNAFGLHDMIGNAGEWVGSLDGQDDGVGPFTDRGARLAGSGLHFAQWRGGAWNQWPNTLRAGAVASDPPGGRGPGIGFRLAQTVFPVQR